VKTEWVAVSRLRTGDRVLLHDHRSGAGWEGPHNEEEGYLMGLLLGDGTLKSDKAILSSWSKAGTGEIDGSEGVRLEALQYAMALPHLADFGGWIPVKGRNEMRMAPGSLKTLAQELGLRPGHKVITPEVEKCSSSFYRGFLRGLYDADGSVQGSQAKGVSIRLSQSDRETLQAVQRMLIRLGIRSTLYSSRKPAGQSLLPDGKGGMARYPTQEQYELVISCENLQRFAEQVGFADTEKNARLEKALHAYRRALNREPFVATVIGIEPAGTADVYDVQVPGIFAFDANGFYLHNCGEQPLLPYEACNLGSINLVRMVSSSDETVGIDWDRLRDTVHLAVHFLDNVIDQNHYPLPEIAEMARGNRKIGLGVMGWADFLVRLQIPYDSPEALNLAEKLMEFIHREGIAASVQLATSRGVFPHFDQSIYAASGPRLRNATITTIAPTGTLSILAGCSSGIEPLFAIIYLRTVMDKTRMEEINPYFEHLAQLRGFHSPELMHAIAERGSIRGMDTVPKDIQTIFPIAYDVSPESHLRMQAAFQRHTDNAVSKTVNFSKDATEQDVERVFLLAFREGCKGVTIYRDGSRQEQVLSIPSNVKQEKDWEELAQSRHKVARERPKMTRGTTERVETPRGRIYVTVNEDEAGICEVFVESRDQEADGLSRLISLALRAGVDPQEIVEQLWRCESREAINDFSADGTRVLVRSIAQGVALAMGRRIWGPGYAGPFGHRTNDSLFTKPSAEPDGKRTIGGVCPECGNTLEYVEGCLVCRYCGYSKCA
jgi:ribonucleoside-diphosphate reductase alpha chain